MRVRENLVRVVSGLAIAGVSVLAVGAVTSASAEAVSAARTARSPGAIAGDPALCYRIGYKLLCIASGASEGQVEPTTADERQAPMAPPVRRSGPVS